jgi:hypothetical protein
MFKLVFISVLLITHANYIPNPDPDLLKLSVKVYEAISKANEALEDIKNVEQVVRDIENGETPSVTENKWAKLGEKYSTVAKEVRQAPLPTDFDQKKYKVELNDLQSCATREKSLTKIKGFLQELKEAQVRGQNSIIDLDKSLFEADKSREALTYLIKVHEKLVDVPIYGSIFTWDWFELNTSVSTSLGDLTSALKFQRQKIDAELKKLSLYIPNLEGNLTLFDLSQCSIVGRWEGKRIPSFNPNGGTPFSVEFKMLGSSYSGTMTFQLFSTVTENLSVINLLGQQIEFKTASSTLCKGTISSNYQQITGTMITPAGKPSGTCNLNKKS